MALLITCLSVGVVRSQSSTFVTITGVVQDPSGAVVPGASIEATQTQRSFKYTAQSNDAGQYTLANLLEGTYMLVVRAAGFRDFKAENIIVTNGDIRRVDAILAMGTAATSIEVAEAAAGATLIETETARIADTRDREVYYKYPLGDDALFSVMVYAPQATFTSNWNLRLAGSTEVMQTIDGADTNSPTGGWEPTVVGRSEMFQEVHVDIAQGNAEQISLGQVVVVSRSGTNQLHGTARETYSNWKANARDPFQLVKMPSSEYWPHRAAAGIGGPIYLPKIYNGKNRSFFFFALEHWNGPKMPYTEQRSVPLNRWRSGDFSTVAGTAVRDPFNGNAPFPGNAIPASRINPVARAYQEMLIPGQNYGGPDTFDPKVPTYVKTYGRLLAPVRRPTATIRLDHRISDKQFLFGRWNAIRWNMSRPETIFPQLTPKRNYHRNLNNIALGHTYVIRSNLLNEVLYGLMTREDPSQSAWRGLDVVKQLGFQGLVDNLPDVTGLPAVSFQRSGLAAVSSAADCKPCGQYRTHSFNDNVSWFHNGHSFKFGVNLHYLVSRTQSQSGSLFGSSVFSGNFTGFDYADFLLGIPTTMSRSFPALLRDMRHWSQGYYAQDNWKVSNKLTLNLGLRWDAQMPWSEVNGGLLSAFDPASGRIVVPNGSLNRVSSLLPRGYVDVVGASTLGYPKNLVNTDWKNFQPRMGLAYRPWGNRTVFRGGLGLAYALQQRSPTQVGVPYVISEPSYTNPADNPLVWPVEFPSTGSGRPTTVSLPGAIDPNLQVPRVIQYSATIEHQRWDTGFMIQYVGTGTRQGVYTYNINQPVADARLYINKPRAFPNYSDISYTGNGAGHQYHALTFQALRKQMRNLYAQTYFTWAKDIYDLEAGQSPEDTYNRARERAPYQEQPKFRFCSTTIYQFPIGRGQKFLNHAHWLVNGLVGGWRLSTIFVQESGRPLTAMWTGPDPTGTRYSGSSTRPTVTIRPDALRNPNLANPTQYGWFDVKAFAAPQLGLFGSEAKGVIVGPAPMTFSNALAKEFPIRERARLQFELLVPNTFNHPNWAAPQTNVTNATAGLSTAISGQVRWIQVQGRLEW